MIGIEVAVILFACAFAIIALWSAPLWMRVLTGVVARLSGQVDRASEEIQEEQKVFPKEER